MNSNTIFCFTGTGNSLKAAKDISMQLPDCDIQSWSGSSRHYSASLCTTKMTVA